MTEVLEKIPARLKMIRHVRPKLSCRSCETVIQARSPDLPIEKGRPGPGLIANVMVSKYLDGLRKRPWARWTPGDAEAEHYRSWQWLLERLAEPHNGPTIVATHHVPHSIARHPEFELDHISATIIGRWT
jgi:hypothetical protein